MITLPELIMVFLLSAYEIWVRLCFHGLFVHRGEGDLYLGGGILSWLRVGVVFSVQTAGVYHMHVSWHIYQTFDADMFYISLLASVEG